MEGKEEGGLSNVRRRAVKEEDNANRFRESVSRSMSH